MRRLALFLSGVVAGLLAAYIAAVAAAWRWLTVTRRHP